MLWISLLKFLGEHWWILLCSPFNCRILKATSQLTVLHSLSFSAHLVQHGIFSTSQMINFKMWHGRIIPVNAHFCATYSRHSIAPKIKICLTTLVGNSYLVCHWTLCTYTPTKVCRQHHWLRHQPASYHCVVLKIGHDACKEMHVAEQFVTKKFRWC